MCSKTPSTNLFGCYTVFAVFKASDFDVQQINIRFSFFKCTFKFLRINIFIQLRIWNHIPLTYSIILKLLLQIRLLTFIKILLYLLSKCAFSFHRIYIFMRTKRQLKNIFHNLIQFNCMSKMNFIKLRWY